MALGEADRKTLLTDLGLAPDGASLSLAPKPDEEPKLPEQPEPDEIPDVEDLTDEELLAPDAFDRHKLAASVVGRAVSSPHNKRLYARINDAKDRQRKAEQQAKRKEKDARRKEDRKEVREKVKADTTERATKAVMEALAEAGIDLDALAALLKERDGDN